MFLVSTILTPPIFATDAIPNQELAGILQKIEARHYRWIAIRADVLLFFATAKDSSGMCGGELLYQRLDERMFLSCVDTRKELVFAFRTLDRRFDLYLPAQNTVYHGSIFDLEDSPDIESHLKARDLYRALKPMAVDPRRTRVERTNLAITSLDVYGPKGPEEGLVRKLYLTPEGDVRGEIFYGANGRSTTEIQRYGFRELPSHVGSLHSVIFPKKITIVSPETQKASAIFFMQVRALDTIDPLEFILRVPDGTKEVFLDEKDPRFAFRQLKLGEKLVKNVPQTLPPGKKVKPETPRPVRTPTVVAPETHTPKNADADVAVEDQASTDQPSVSRTSAADEQTSLDPSVEPSVNAGERGTGNEKSS